MRRPDGRPGTTPQQQADAAEAEALSRYLAMRTLWMPCWGATPAPDKRRGRVTPR